MRYFAEPGDILPAIEAINMIDRTDLSSPIFVPPIPAEAYPENISEEERQWLEAKIRRSKGEHNALLLAHNYESRDVRRNADVVGDSLTLAKAGAASNADVLLEAAVLFMNQTLAIMARPNQIVLTPSLQALCSLAAHADMNKIKQWKLEYPRGIVISYINTYIDVKALSDYCCASGNAVEVVELVFNISEKDQEVLLLPDVFLGLHVAKTLQKKGYSLERLWLMMGACHVHEQIKPQHIEDARKRYPKAKMAVHLECGCQSRCVTRLGDTNLDGQMEMLSTQGMIDFAKKTTADTIIVATEKEMGEVIAEVSGKKVVLASEAAICPFMKQNTLRLVRDSLERMEHRIVVDPELARRAYIPVKRMLKITRPEHMAGGE